MTTRYRYNSTFKVREHGLSRKPRKPLGWTGRLKRSRMKVKPDRKLAAWSKAVRERDENQCRFPETTCLNRGTLHAHHIAPRGRRPDLVYELSNGVTLCFIHHQWCHDHPIEATALGLLSDESYELSHDTTKMHPKKMRELYVLETDRDSRRTTN